MSGNHFKRDLTKTNVFQGFHIMDGCSDSLWGVLVVDFFPYCSPITALQNLFFCVVFFSSENQFNTIMKEASGEVIHIFGPFQQNRKSQ